MAKYAVPSSSADAWRAHQRTNRTQNPGLIIDRYSLDWSDNEQLKRQSLEQVRDASDKIDQALLQAVNQRWESGVKSRFAKPITFQTDWRFVTGLGRKGPLEIGFTFNRYGFSYLPGSSVKGLARAWAFSNLIEILGVDKIKQIEDLLLEADEEYYEKQFSHLFTDHPSSDQAKQLADNVRLIFGTTGQKGRAIFFDAIPATPPRLEIDIMNPHYPDYYQGVDPPANWQSPIPIPFLVVAPQVPFRFAIGWRAEPDDQLQQLTQEWLIKALHYLGAGGKTSAGYGYFSETADVTIEIDQQQLQPRVKKELPPGYVRGVVKVFGLGARRSYGFIFPSDGGPEIFVHITSLAQGLETLETDQKVIFKPELNPRGKLEAKDVQLDE